MVLALDTELTALADIDHPILLAPMGGVAGGRLAAAVSAGGGLGMVGAGYGDPEWLVRELAAAGTTRVGIGFITFALQQRPDTLRVALEHRPVAVQLSFGDPAPFADRIHDAGALLIAQVQTLDEARHAAAVGADIVIAQGQDSGGHGRGGHGTLAFVPAIVDAVTPTPVVAAGGIADGRGLLAALSLGAAGVSLGTRFYATHEALAEEAARQLLVTATAEDTIRTPAFDLLRGPAWPSGIDGRALVNDTTRRWADDAGGASRDELAEIYRSAANDDYSVRALWAGESVSLVADIRSAAAVITTIVDDAVRRLHALGVSAATQRERSEEPGASPR